MQINKNKIYRIKIAAVVYKNKKLIYRNEVTLPTIYNLRSECRKHILRETQYRLRNSNFFISPRIDFDLVRYTQEATSNTYLRYRVIEEKIVKNAKKSNLILEDAPKTKELNSSQKLSKDKEQKQNKNLLS